MKKLTILLVVLLQAGCASWYTSPGELAEMKARRQAVAVNDNCGMDETGNLRCKSVAPDGFVEAAPHVHIHNNLLK